MNTTTDQQDDVWKRPFIDLIAQLNGGQHAVEATDTVNELVQGIRQTGRKGSMSIVIEMEPTKDNKDLMLIRVRVVPKIPKPAPKPAILFATDDGNLQSEDPRQMPFEQLKVVETVTAEVKTAPTRTELKEVASQ